MASSSHSSEFSMATFSSMRRSRCALSSRTCFSSVRFSSLADARPFTCCCSCARSLMSACTCRRVLETTISCSASSVFSRSALERASASRCVSASLFAFRASSFSRESASSLRVSVLVRNSSSCSTSVTSFIFSSLRSTTRFMSLFVIDSSSCSTLAETSRVRWRSRRSSSAWPAACLRSTASAASLSASAFFRRSSSWAISL
mmetsp:Transcript_3263/g.13228  ORF Transcript_3263/g.13228 Transcript_3263/m.13228 type:complete len:203 (+) Transcript_3263:617-1225(+)